jgi:hypothetical protein
MMGSACVTDHADKGIVRLVAGHHTLKGDEGGGAVDGKEFDPAVLKAVAEKCNVRSNGDEHVQREKRVAKKIQAGGRWQRESQCWPGTCVHGIAQKQTPGTCRRQPSPR